MPKFVGVILYTKKVIWMLIRLNRSMKESLQVVFKKVNKQESIIAAKREVKKKTEFVVMQLQWLVNDSQYNCNIYIYDIEKFKPRRNESTKARAWRHFSYNAFAKLVTQRRTTPSLTKYWKDIIELCKATLAIKEENKHLRNMRE